MSECQMFLEQNQFNNTALLRKKKLFQSPLPCDDGALKKECPSGAKSCFGEDTRRLKHKRKTTKEAYQNGQQVLKC